MGILGRKTLKSKRAQMRTIDMVFERVAQTLLISYFIFTLVSWTTLRESFRIEHISVLGAQATNTEAIEMLAHEFLSQKFLWKINRNNALLYPKQSLATAVLTLDSRLKNIDIAVEENSLLTLRVTEYVPSYLWCNGATRATSTPPVCYLADDTGYVFAKAPDYSGYPFDVFETSIAGSDEQESPIGLFMLPEEEFAKVSAFRLALEKSGITTHRIAQTGEFDYTLTTDAPWVVVWSSTKDPNVSARNLDIVLGDIKSRKGKGKGTTTPSSIDLRFGSKIFYQ